MIYYHGAAPGGTGVRDTWVNCGKLDGPCLAELFDSFDRGAAWAASASDYAVFGPITASIYPVRFSRLVVVEGYNTAGTASDVVRIGTVGVPFFFANFESGDLRFWSTTSP